MGIESIKIPMLRDRHSHPLLYASWIDGLSLLTVDSKQEALRQINDHPRTDGEVMIVHGWLDSKFELTCEDVEHLGPTAVFNLSLHGLVMNAGATAMVESVMKDAETDWTNQIWFERNLRPILNAFAMLNGTAGRLKRFFEHLEHEHGVSYAEEMLLAGEKEIDLFREAGLLNRTRFWCSFDMWQTLSPKAQSKIYGMKIFADGALGVRTAAVHLPFDNGDCGMLMYSDDELESLVIDCAATEKAIAIHAIGDRAIEQVVQLVHRHRANDGFHNEVRIEHAQLISLEMAKLAKEANITLSMQPNFSIDSTEYSDRMPKQYCEGNNPFRMLIDDVGFIPGKDLIFGSDGMPHGAKEAIRQSLSPPYPDRQRLSVDELVAGYCDASVLAHDGLVKVSVSQL